MKKMEEGKKKHRERRNPHGKPYEGYLDLDKAVENNKKYILLDCVTIMTTNIMFKDEKDLEKISMEGSG